MMAGFTANIFSLLVTADKFWIPDMKQRQNRKGISMKAYGRAGQTWLVSAHGLSFENLTCLIFLLATGNQSLAPAIPRPH
jgi:hypothetical protein